MVVIVLWWLEAVDVIAAGGFGYSVLESGVVCRIKSSSCERGKKAGESWMGIRDVFIFCGDG